MTHPILHGCFHSLASLGYIPFTLTSVYIASSTPLLSISPVGIILLAFIPPLTLFPILCLFYRRLERFDAISLAVQRARIYIMIAGSGLCVLVAAHMIMIHVINNSYSYDITPISHPSSRMDVRTATYWISGGNSNNNSTDNVSTIASIRVSPIDRLVIDQPEKNTTITGIDVDKVYQSITAKNNNGNEHLNQAQSIGKSEAMTPATTASTTKNTISQLSPSQLGSQSSGLKFSLSSIHFLLFLFAQSGLLILLTTLFLGVLIMTEYLLDREDEDEDETKTRWYFWGRVLGVVTATIVSAVHGSILSAYILMDSQSDYLAKTVVGTIIFYWIGMITLMNRATGPLPF